MLIKEKKLKDGLDDTAITAEAKYFANITKSRKKNCSRLHYNGIKKFLYASSVKIYQFKTKDSEIKPYRLCLGNIAKGFIVNNMKKLG